MEIENSRLALEDRALRDTTCLWYESQRTLVRKFGRILGSCVRSTRTEQYQQTCQKHVSGREPHLEPAAENQVFELTRHPPATSDPHLPSHSIVRDPGVSTRRWIEWTIYRTITRRCCFRLVRFQRRSIATMIDLSTHDRLPYQRSEQNGRLTNKSREFQEYENILVESTITFHDEIVFLEEEITLNRSSGRRMKEQRSFSKGFFSNCRLFCLRSILSSADRHGHTCSLLVGTRREPRRNLLINKTSRRFFRRRSEAPFCPFFRRPSFVPRVPASFEFLRIPPVVCFV